MDLPLLSYVIGGSYLTFLCLDIRICKGEVIEVRHSQSGGGYEDSPN